jgi:hypothetical protein
MFFSRLRRLDAIWRIVSGVVYQFGDAITIHVLGWIRPEQRFYRLLVAPLVNPPQPMVGMAVGRSETRRWHPEFTRLHRISGRQSTFIPATSSSAFSFRPHDGHKKRNSIIQGLSLLSRDDKQPAAQIKAKECAFAEVSTVNLVSRRKKPRELSTASSFAASTNSPAMNADPATLKKLPLFRMRLTGHVWFPMADAFLPTIQGLARRKINFLSAK